MMNVFITGVSSGIGKSLAYFYAEQGATVGICARRQNRLQIVEEKIKSLGGEAIPFILDVADQEACQMAIEQFLAETESIDIVIANAGIGGVDDISSGSPSTMNKILSINILGVTNTITPFIPIMKKQKFGRIC
ncbi:MAG: SDR family oxidoreductase, partial [Candidatus Marinimicrobia bacterium]|nr:SDR family oxidoreductase [Candidatus Neomarinimicrobiota bacterium]MBT5355941.1 SDR family oxidoreductase [Candidatus Neomarinimicrobiota bacterium]MBT6914996.1 SDR family oxidoreductase [Candidatus Neomarinimicrobiota bacterium]MBT7185034.1 SDR family oxidoreductase [Candidatus Neomarinimicrobiota bacterium]